LFAALESGEGQRNGKAGYFLPELFSLQQAWHHQYFHYEQ
jgi:hypothetical protein